MDLNNDTEVKELGSNCRYQVWINMMLNNNTERCKINMSLTVPIPITKNKIVDIGFIVIHMIVDMCGVAAKRWTSDLNVTGLRPPLATRHIRYVLLFFFTISNTLLKIQANG